MRKIYFSISFSLLLVVSVYAQDRNRYLLDIYEYNEQLDELVDRVRDSLGGRERNLELSSYQSNGEITFQTGEKALFDLFYMKNDWVRIDQKTENEYTLFGRHGKRGWQKIHSKMEESKEKALKGRELSELEQFSFYENNLFDYEKKRLDIYFEGEVKVGELEAYIIRLSGFKYGEEMYYISKETFRPFMKQVYILDDNYQSVINYTIDDYIKIDGVLLPRKIGIKMNGNTKVMEFFKYSLAAKFDKKLFLN